MKNILFISVTRYNFQEQGKVEHFGKKFKPLAQKARIFVLAKGQGFHYKIWNCDFYLLKPNFLFWLRAFFLAFYLCWMKKIDVIVSQSPLAEGFCGAILSKIFKAELVVEIHGDWMEGPFLSKKRKGEKLLRKLIPFLAKFSLRSAHKIRAVAEYLKIEAQKIAPEKPYFVFHTFTNLDIFLAEKNIAFENFILFVGQLAKVKGVNFLLDAWAEVIKEFPNFKLVIVGDGEEYNQLKIKSEKLFGKLRVVSGAEPLKINEIIDFRGKVSLGEVKNLMARCYCLVLPSLSEGLPRVIIEAMALGKSVVASNVGGIPDLVKDNETGLLVKPADSEDLANKLKFLLGNQKLAEKLGQQARQMVLKNFSNQQYLDDYLRMLIEL